jgi:predicted Zn finger-like uncharacterized protein
MIITCPECKRKYRLEDSQVKAPYQKMRCSRCGHIFVYDGGRHFEREEKVFTGPLSAGFSALFAETPVRKKSRKGLTALVVFILILLALAAVGWYTWMNHTGAGNRWLKLQKVEGEETVTRDGKIFLIRGTVVNGSTKPRKYVILTAKLFDQQGAIIGEHVDLAGLPLSSDEVRQMQKSDIEKKVADFRKASLSAFVLSPAKEMPFSIVFSDIYSGKLKEFSVEVIESPSL